MTEQLSALDPSWAQYPDTILELATARGRCVLDLRVALDSHTRESLRALGLDRPFAVVTACDPHGRPLDAGENARRTETLRAELAAAGVLLGDATGRSPDRAHAEPGFACTLPRDGAAALARRYGQSALFWFDGRKVSLVGACVDAPDLPLPVGGGLPVVDTPPTIRVIAAVVARGDALLVCQRPAHKRHGGLWEFPGGKCEPGESDVDAARRELHEELGVEVLATGPEELAIHDPGSPFLIVFVPVTIAGEPVTHEHQALCWGTPADLAKLPLAPSDRQYVEHRLAREAGRG